MYYTKDTKRALSGVLTFSMAMYEGYIKAMNMKGYISLKVNNN